MASLVGTIRSVFGDQWWIVKLAIAVYALYFSINHAPQYIQSTEAQYIFYCIVGLIFLGCGTVAMYRNLNNQAPLFPGLLSIPDVFVKTVGAVISMIPGSIMTAAIIYIVNTMSIEMLVKYIVFGISLIILIPFFIIPLVLYSARGKISDAFKYNIVFTAAGNFIMTFIVYLLQFVLIFCIAFACLYFFLMQMFGAEHISISILIYIFAVMTFFTTLIYFSDLYDDVIPAIASKD